MTRFLERDNGTQVNSNLIGVQVRPEVVPPTYEVSELTANVQVDEVECTNKMNGLPMLYVNSGSGDEIWGYTGNQEEYNGTVYNVWSCVMGSTAYNMFTDSNDTITDQTQFYIHPEGPDDPPVMPAPPSKYMLSYEGVMVRFDPNDYLYVTGSQVTYTLVDGFILDKDTTGQFVGKVVSDSLTNSVYTCVYDSEEGQYTKWRVDFNAEVYLYSTIRNPSVGYNLRSNHYSSKVYFSPILTVTKDEVDPGYTEDVNCGVSYSVDGETWTAWPENLTDDNNVIANVPRYMFLKFGQDVEITEE